MEKQNIKTLAKDKLEFVSSIITDNSGKIFVFKRRQDLKLDPGKYDFCSGHMKDGEIPLQSMYRELKEELGLEVCDIKKIEMIDSINTPHKKFLDCITHVYHVQISENNKIKEMINKVEEPEMEDVKYVDSINELCEMIKKSDKFRVIHTVEFEKTLRQIEERINKRKEETLNYAKKDNSRELENE